MVEELLVTARANPAVDPVIHIWTWEVAVYLFLGGLTAGILCIAALVHLFGKEYEFPAAATRLPLWAPVVLSVGMTTLFMDLEHKLYVYRFYTTLQPTSPMSWGSWILVLVYPLSLLQIASVLRRGYPALAAAGERLPLVTPLLDLAEKHRMSIAAACVPVGAALGIYTGILLSGFSARPFWNTSILGPLFLVSGLSAAAALAILVARDHRERLAFARVDLALIAVELLFVALMIIGLSVGSRVQLEALELILGGPFTMIFWFGFVGIGLLVPLVLEAAELSGRVRLAVLAPVLVLVGGFLLRQVTLDVGQASTWQDYAVSHDPYLLERMHDVRN
jgi:formate-dependent nitrite reductase membrane component NrfD